MTPDSLSLFKAVFESTADGILIVGADGKVLEYNHRFSEIWKIPKDILETRNDDKLLSFIQDQLLYPEKFLQKVKDLYDKPEAISSDVVEFKDGRFFERYSIPLKSEKGILGRVWRFQDVTELRIMEEKFQQIAELSPDIISIISPEGKLVFNSSASHRIHGFSAEEMEGMDTFQFIHPEDQAIVQEEMGKLISDPSYVCTVQYRYRNKDGSYSWMEATACNQINNPRVNGLVTISREINSRKKMERDLNLALKTRDDFISFTSHELNTPVTLFKLKLQILKKNFEKERKNPDVKDYDSLIDQTKSMQKLIEDLLSLSRIRAGKLSYFPEKFNLSILIEEILFKYKETFDAEKINVSGLVLPNIFIEADQLRIGQVVTNLISNAIKYAPHSPIQIDLAKADKFARLTIKDFGPGIPPENHESIFELFERATRKDYMPGLGIGLYLCKNIVEAMNGTIQVISRTGEGASFIVKLPLVEV